MAVDFTGQAVGQALSEFFEQLRAFLLDILVGLHQEAHELIEHFFSSVRELIFENRNVISKALYAGYGNFVSCRVLDWVHDDFDPLQQRNTLILSCVIGWERVSHEDEHTMNHG